MSRVASVGSSFRGCGFLIRGWAIVISGCTTTETVDAAPATDAGTDAVSACSIDSVCPDRIPAGGTLCVAPLSCTFDTSGCDLPWTSECVDGRWQVTEPPAASCTTPPVPFMGERCSDPFMGTLPSPVTLALPSDAFVWGPQGAAMVPIDVTLGGAAADLTCLDARLTLVVDGERQAVPGSLYPRFRCGASTGFLLLVSTPPCAAGPHTVEVDVELVGVGSASASRTMTGGGGAVCM